MISSKEFVENIQRWKNTMPSAAEWATKIRNALRVTQKSKICEPTHREGAKNAKESQEIS